MLRVEFITTEDEADLIVSFANVSAVEEGEVGQAKAVLRKMVKDGAAQLDGV